MQVPLPARWLVKTTRSAANLDDASAARVEQLLLLVPQDAEAVPWQTLPGGAALRKVAARHHGKPPVPLATTRLDNAPATSVLVAGVAAYAAPFRLLDTARQLVAAGLAEQPASIGIAACGFDEETAERFVRGLFRALQAAAFALPKFTREAPPRPRLKQLRVFGTRPRFNLRAAEAAAEGNNLARWLTAMPPDRLGAGDYRRLVARLARAHGWQHRFLDEKALRQAGAGAFLAVARANPDRDAGIVHLRYRPRRATRPSLALVGKGIVFDTGGANLKPFKAMLDMHMDMAGSATALGTLLALTRLEVDYPIDCWLAITPNRIGSRAYTAHEVLTASNGVTIQVVHTDAEGRLVLADTLALAGRERPRLIIDYATLTGSCVAALTDRYSGVFTNRPALHAPLVAAGRESGERVWPFPLDDDFDEHLKSDTADVLQCAIANEGDHILAARFLSRFVPEDCAWVHMDMAAGMRNDGLGAVGTKATGFGVDYTLELLGGQSAGPCALASLAR